MRRDATSKFVTVKTEGGLIPAEFLARIADEDPTIPGLGSEDYGLLPYERLTDGAQRAWTYLTGAWKSFQDALAKTRDDDHAVRLTRERWLLPLFRELGYGVVPTTRPVDVEGKTYALSHLWENRVAIHCMGYRITLDQRTKSVPGAAKASPHGLVQEFLNRSDDHLWGVVTNGRQLRILRDHHSLTRQAYVEFDLETMFEGELAAEFFLLWRVLQASRSTGEKPSDAWLEKWFQQARDEGVRALDKLRDGVKGAIAALGSGFLKRRENELLHQQLESGELDKQDYYRQLLRLVYRLIFLFVAEDRDLLLDPEAEDDAKELYRRFYSTSRLRKLAERRRSSPYTDLWHALRLVMTKLDEGCPELALPALDSFLWRDDAVADLIHAELGNEDLLDAVDAMSHIVEKGVRLPVSWQSLGAEELGSVYESLLEQHPEIHRDTATFELATAAGHERKTTGSYYTPSSLVDCLLDSALDPVVDEAALKDDPELAILDLKVCDPACGSGHFLVAAARRIAKRLANVRSGDEEPSPEEMQHALRDVVGRCIYGVDINSMAVELCKVSLWMEALEPGKPLSFLDHHIQWGNSLLGATPALLRKGIPDEAFTPIEGDDKAFCRELKKRNKAERETRQRSLFAEGYDPMRRFGDLRTVIGQIDAIDDSTLAGVRDKERRWYQVRDSRDYLYGRMWTDAWCAAFVWEKVDDPSKPFPITEELFRVMEENPNHVTQDVRAEIRRLAKEYQFFHWHLAFPDVFVLPKDREKAESEKSGWDGGFAVVLGNPPWEKLQSEELIFFAQHAPSMVMLKSMARKEAIRELETRDPSLHLAWLKQRRRDLARVEFIRSSSLFPKTGVGKFNSFAIFAEEMSGVVKSKGRVGCIVPSSIVTDSSTSLFFQYLTDNDLLISVFDFENRLAIFPAVHRSYKFCLLTFAGSSISPRRDAEFSFFLLKAEELAVPQRRFTLSAADILTLNPSTRTCPIFRSLRDANICKGIFRRLPILASATHHLLAIDEVWQLRLHRMFNMSDDSESFIDIGELSSGQGVDASMLPLYEAKMIHQYDYLWGQEKGSGESEGWRESARFAISGQLVQDRLQKKNWKRRWLLGWRDIARSTDERTVIATLIPLSGVGNTIFLIYPDREEVQCAVCLVANLSSFVLDYSARQKIAGAHMNQGYLSQLPVVSPRIFWQKCPWLGCSTVDWIRLRVLELLFITYDLYDFALDAGYDGPPFKWDEDRRRMLRAELDAAFFHLYGIERDDVDYIMETFPIVKRKDVKQFGDFRTKLMILHVYDAIAKAMETGEPYQTMLDPPPADPRVAHPPRDADALHVAPEAHASNQPLRFPVPEPSPEYRPEVEDELMVAEEAVEYVPAGPASAEATASSVASAHDVGMASIVEYLSSRPGWHSRADVLTDVELTAAAWNRAVGELVASGEVEKTGVKRGTRYRYVSAAVASAVAEEDRTLTRPAGVPPAVPVGRIREDGTRTRAAGGTPAVTQGHAAVGRWLESKFSDSAFGAARTARRSAVVEWLTARPGWHARSDVLADVEVTAAEWKRATDELLASGEIERKGQKRGARYRSTSVPVPDELEAGAEFVEASDEEVGDFDEVEARRYKAVLDWLDAHAGWHARADVLADVDLTEAEWNQVIGVLVETGEVERKGEKRGTRYRWRGDDRRLLAWWFTEHPGWHARQEIVTDLEIDAGSWNRAIHELVESDEVVRKGEKRGTRYRWWEHEERLLF